MVYDIHVASAHAARADRMPGGLPALACVVEQSLVIRYFGAGSDFADDIGCDCGLRCDVADEL